MNYEACRYAFDCLNTTEWWEGITLWTLAGAIVAGAVIWMVRRWS